MVQETLSCGYLAVMARGGVPGGRNRAGTSLTVYFVNSVARSLLWAKYLLGFPGAREIIKCTSHQGHGCPVPTLQVRRPGLRGSTSPSRARAWIHSSVRSQVPWVLPVPSPHSPPAALCIQQVLTKCLRRERIRRCWGSFILFQGRLPRTQDGAMPQGSRTQDTP